MLTVPLPAMVFVGKATKYWIWATKTKKFAPDASLFRVPLPNVYLEWGQICWGVNTPPECNAQTINSAWEMFVTSPFNSHLSSNKSRRHDRDIREQLLALYSKKAKKYPVSDLQPLSRDLTVNKLLEAIANDSN
jgi:PRTRC genetic system protein B